MMEMMMEEDGCLWTFVLWVCISIGRIIEIASVIMRIKILAVITLIMCYRVGTCRKPVFVEVGNCIGYI